MVLRFVVEVFGDFWRWLVRVIFGEKFFTLDKIKLCEKGIGVPCPLFHH